MSTKDQKRGRAPGVGVPNLKHVRLMRGYTVRGLAADAGVNSSTVAALENGHRGAQGSTLRKLAETLGVETQDLVGDALGEAPPRSRASGSRVRVAATGEPNVEAMRLLDSWSTEDPGYDQEVLPELQRNIDADRPSYRKLYS